MGMSSGVVVRLPEIREVLLKITGDQFAGRAGVPIGREQCRIVAVGETFVDQHDDTHVRFRANDPAR